MGRLLFVLFTILGVKLLAADFAIVTLAAGDKYKEQVRPGIENKRAYAKLHGYDFIYSEEIQDPTRHVYWSKIPLVLKALENPEHKWVAWIDADTLIMNQGIALNDLIDENFDFIISRDFNGINSGVFFIRNCDWSRNFLKNVYAREDCLSHMWPEQEAIILELKEKIECSSHAKVVPQRMFNSFPEENSPKADSLERLSVMYQSGDFLIHFASFHDELPALFEKYRPLVINDPGLFNLDRYLSIYGFQLPTNENGVGLSDSQKRQFREELKRHPEVHSIAHIGVNDGKSVEYLYQLCKRVNKFVTFDTNKNPYTAPAVEFLANRHKESFEFYPGEASLKVTEYASHFPDQKFDLIYIDGTHSFEGCLKDLINCKAFAHSNTMLWIDGYSESPTLQAIALGQKMGFIDLKSTHHIRDEIGSRSWIEAQYRFN